MGISDLKILNAELPELFQLRGLSPSWDEELIIVAIEDPELVSSESPLGDNRITFNRNPTDADLEEIGSNFIQPGAQPPELSTIILELFGGAHSGAPVSYVDPNKMPPTDCLAFYLPFHYYYPDWWGVYLLFEGVVWLAGEIIKRSGGTIDRRRAMEAARLFLYYHEAFHHKTECFSTRLELSHRKPFYKTGFERLYQDTIGKPICLEEGLANATALIDGKKKLRDIAVDEALAGYVNDSPPGYDRGNAIRPKFDSVRCDFAEQNHHICLPHLPSKSPKVWRTAPYMFNGIANIKSRVNYVIPRSSPLAKRLPFRPLLPPNKLVQKLKSLVGLEFVRNGGNHDIWRTSTGKRVPIPRHQRDLGRGLVRKILREVGLEIGLEEFLQL